MIPAMTYQQAYNKIIEAYFKDEIIPMNDQFCFCGTLSPDSSWRYAADYPYTSDEYRRMELALFGFMESPYPDCDRVRALGLYGSTFRDYEDHLFNGMCAALEVLKEIHRERGEDVDGVPQFTKRTLNHQQ